MSAGAPFPHCGAAHGVGRGPRAGPEVRRKYVRVSETESRGGASDSRAAAGGGRAARATARAFREIRFSSKNKRGSRSGHRPSLCIRALANDQCITTRHIAPWLLAVPPHSTHTQYNVICRPASRFASPLFRRRDFSPSPSSPQARDASPCLPSSCASRQRPACFCSRGWRSPTAGRG